MSKDIESAIIKVNNLYKENPEMFDIKGKHGMSDLLTKTIRALHIIETVIGVMPDRYYVPEIDWHRLKRELEERAMSYTSEKKLPLRAYKYFLLYEVEIIPETSEEESDNELVRDDGQFGMGA